FAFQYGTSRHYEFQTPLAAAGSATSSVRVSEVIKGLRADTTYHYRLVAFGITTATGRDRTFRTAKVPRSLAIAGARNPAAVGGGHGRTCVDVAPHERGRRLGFEPRRAGHRPVSDGGTVVIAGTPAVARFSGVVHIRHHGLFRALVKTSDPSHVSGYSAPIL